MCACESAVYFMYVCMFMCVLLSLHSLYQCTFRLYCILCAAFGVINDDDCVKLLTDFRNDGRPKRGDLLPTPDRY